MNDSILVEFVYNEHEFLDVMTRLSAFTNDTISISNISTTDHILTCRMASETSTIIKLSDSFLSDRMRVSYIPSELKDKYRK